MAKTGEPSAYYCDKDDYAFPGSLSGVRGMTLRDFFAAAALAGWIAGAKGEEFDKRPTRLQLWKEIASQDAYGFADAMMAERAKMREEKSLSS